MDSQRDDSLEVLADQLTLNFKYHESDRPSRDFITTSPRSDIEESTEYTELELPISYIAVGMSHK
jgi:hypothetical protein